MKFKAIKGVRDILPPESALWNYAEQTARKVFGTYGFSEIRLPIFEQTELFARSIGVDTDVVSKEMYTMIDARSLEDEDASELSVAIGKPQLTKEGLARLTEAADEQIRRIRKASEGASLTLRPEATASVARAYIEHGMQTQPGNVKLYYIGPMFRRERPQKGRYRQFYQIGAEVLGPSDAPGIDAETIEMLMNLFERLGLPIDSAERSNGKAAAEGAVLYINSIGDKNCRPAYVECLREELRKVREQLGPDSQRRIETNPLRVLDSKLESEQAVIEKLPRIGERLCADCRAHYEEVKRQLRLRGIPFQENWRLVRGLDYYTRTTFEITAPGLGSQNAVCGGGRYDGLVELLGGPAGTRGIGFAIGADRLMLSLQETGVIQSPVGLDVFLAWFGGAAQAAGIQLARRLREAGFVVESPATEMKFGKALNLADRLKARHAVILGEDEIASGVLTVKRLADGTQQKLPEAELFAYLHTARGS